MILYVSWGGSGWAASVRQAMTRAAEAADGDQPGLRYLALLDDASFGGLDRVGGLDLVIDELRWLLDAQLELIRSQVGAQDLDVEIIVRAGSIVDTVAEVAEATEGALVAVGAPVSAGGYPSAQALLDDLEARLGRPVLVIEPEGSNVSP